jgi:hypothetical protein
MADIVRKIGKITRYETKTYVGAAKILDLDRSSDERPAHNPGGQPENPASPGKDEWLPKA